MDAFGNDALLNMLRTEDQFTHAAFVCEAFLHKYQKEGVKDLDLPPCYKDSYQAIRLACSGILAIYTPIPGYGGSSAGDAAALLQYNGNNSLLNAVKRLLTSTEAWKKAVMETLALGAVAVKEGPRLRQLTSLVEERKDKVTMTDEFAEGLDCLRNLSSELRAGAMEELENALAQRAKVLARAYVQVTDVSTIDVKDLSLISYALGRLLQFEGVADAKRCFDEWQGGLAQALCSQELQGMAQRYELNPEAGLDIAELLGVLKKVQNAKDVPVTQPALVLLGALRAAIAHKARWWH